MDKIDFLRDYDHFCIDLDGVLWNQKGFVDGSVETLKILEAHDKDIFFVTNNANMTFENLEARFSAESLQVPKAKLYSAGYLLIKYLKKHHPCCQKVSIIGPRSLRRLIQDSGYQVIYPPDFDFSINTFEDLRNFEIEENIEVAIVAYDEGFNYFSSLYLSACVQNGASLIGLHRDRCSISEKLIFPASGCWIKFMETATGLQARILGKPMIDLFSLIQEENEINVNRTVMIGDSMESDVLFGISSGIDTALVLTGVTSFNEIKKFDYSPKYVFSSLRSIFS
jgi:HAD superfamily hydrolase (TIGR01450 family)